MDQEIPFVACDSCAQEGDDSDVQQPVYHPVPHVARDLVSHTAMETNELVTHRPFFSQHGQNFESSFLHLGA